jgi:hypothetical protein
MDKSMQILTPGNLVQLDPSILVFVKLRERAQDLLHNVFGSFVGGVGTARVILAFEII